MTWLVSGWTTESQAYQLDTERVEVVIWLNLKIVSPRHHRLSGFAAGVGRISNRCCRSWTIVPSSSELVNLAVSRRNNATCGDFSLELFLFPVLQLQDRLPGQFVGASFLDGRFQLLRFLYPGVVDQESFPTLRFFEGDLGAEHSQFARLISCGTAAELALAAAR